MARPIVALIYDFDKTLCPKDMEEYTFLPGINVEPDHFWGACREFALQNNMDGILTYMYLMQQMAKDTMPFSRDTLKKLGEGVEFFPGVEGWFQRIREIGDRLDVDVEHYIISSGLTEIIEGSRIGHEFKAVFAASFCYDEAGRPVWPSSAVNYTTKTQYLFRINKGILDMTNDRDLNAFTPEYRRRIPFSNMIYIADGLTDVPCMKMTRQKGGFAIAVHPAGETEMADDMLLQGRCDFSTETDYRSGTDRNHADSPHPRGQRCFHGARKARAARTRAPRRTCAAEYPLLRHCGGCGMIRF